MGGGAAPATILATFAGAVPPSAKRPAQFAVKPRKNPVAGRRRWPVKGKPSSAQHQDKLRAATQDAARSGARMRAGYHRATLAPLVSFILLLGRSLAPSDVSQLIEALAFASHVADGEASPFEHATELQVRLGASSGVHEPLDGSQLAFASVALCHAR